MITFSSGDMLKTPADIRINTVNCVGVMGAGVALAYKTKYPNMYKDYKKACKSGKVNPGQLHIWTDLSGETIINFPTKRHWKEPSKYEDIEAGLISLHKYLFDKGPARVTLPALGCGHGGLDWELVKKLIEKHLEGLEAKIFVFEPSESHIIGNTYRDKTLQASDEELSDQGIITLLPNDKLFPISLRGKTASSIYVKCNIQILEKPTLSLLNSMKPEDNEINAALNCIELIAQPGFNVMVGYDHRLARPIIRRVLEHGGNVIISLAEGLFNFSVRKDLKDVWNDKHIMIVTLSEPKQKWNPKVASRSKDLNLAFADAVLITDPNPQWLTYFKKHNELKIPLFQIKYENQNEESQELSDLINSRLICGNGQINASEIKSICEALGEKELNQHLPIKSSDEKFSNNRLETPIFQPASQIKEKESSYSPLQLEQNKEITNIVTKYPKRLIEVDLSIKKISEHARREKSIRHGHISTLHIWWARRPLAACRAVLCAALWPDPGDSLCPEEFKRKASELMQTFWDPMGVEDRDFNDPLELRKALLDFIADFANWDNSTKKEYLDTSRALTQTAHEALGGIPGTRPLVVDPFAGGGAIPLEALRVGADAYASDLKPVAVLLNKVVLEYIPKYGQNLANEVRKWGHWIKEEAEKELAEFYPKDPDGATPMAYLWARTIQCEGPGCGAEVPLIRSLWIAKKGKRSIALQIIPNSEKKNLDFKIIDNAKAINVGEGTIRRGAATCPICGFTTNVTSVRKQLKIRNGGTADSLLYTIVTTHSGKKGRFYRLPKESDFNAIEKASKELNLRILAHKKSLSLVPDELIPTTSSGFLAPPTYGMDRFDLLFTPRQSLTLAIFSQLVSNVGDKLATEYDNNAAIAIQTCLALVFDRLADKLSSLARWDKSRENPQGTFGRQALPIVWDFNEVNPFSGSGGDWNTALNWVVQVIEKEAKSVNKSLNESHVECATATAHPLPDNSAQCFCTDPPYYNAVPYADLSDFFYIWLKRTIGDKYQDIFIEVLTPKDDECCEMAGWDSTRYPQKDGEWFEKKMGQSLAEGRRIMAPNGIAVVVFAHKSTAGWEAQLQAIINAKWVITGSWPIDTEMGSRLRAMNSSALASSVHLVCRPRENPDGFLLSNDIGDWRDVLQELPVRIHEWMPRLAEEGIVGADAIFACLGPALEIYSRHSSVEKASGEQVTLKEYLEHVWAAVAKEALNMIFKGADATGFEEDARLTAMWLWTLSTRVNGNGSGKTITSDEGEESKSTVSGGFTLEYDAARKIAQGLGAHLEKLTKLVETKGGKARLLPVEERTSYLFGKDEGQTPKGRKKKKGKQLTLSNLLDEIIEEDEDWGDMKAPPAGTTVLDRLHQAMVLFAAGRGEALKRFLVEDGVGRDDRFWRLAQALSALYPPNSNEKRWVDGVMARKKGLGF